MSLRCEDVLTLFVPSLFTSNVSDGVAKPVLRHLPECLNSTFEIVTPLDVAHVIEEFYMAICNRVDNTNYRRTVPSSKTV